MFATTLTLPITSTTGTTTTQAPYYSGSGTNTLTFRYVVMAGQASADLTNNTPIVCPASSCDIARQSGGGVMSSSNGTSLTVAATLLSAGSQVLVDTTVPTAPVFTAGGGTSVANSLNGTNTTLTLTATINAGQVGPAGYAELLLDGASFATPIKTTPGIPSNTTTRVSISLGTTNNAQLQILIPSGGHTLLVRLYDSASPPNVLTRATVLIVADYSPPKFTIVTTAYSGSMAAGSVIPISVNFSLPITTSALSTLTLNTSPTPHNATCVAVTAQPTLVCNYVVVPGDTANPLTYASTTALATTGTVRDAGNNDAVLTLPAINANGLYSAGLNVNAP